MTRLDTTLCGLCALHKGPFKKLLGPTLGSSGTGRAARGSQRACAPLALPSMTPTKVTLKKSQHRPRRSFQEVCDKKISLSP